MVLTFKENSSGCDTIGEVTHTRCLAQAMASNDTILKDYEKLQKKRVVGNVVAVNFLVDSLLNRRVRYFVHVKITKTSHNENLFGLIIYTLVRLEQMVNC